MFLNTHIPKFLNFKELKAWEFTSSLFQSTFKIIEKEGRQISNGASTWQDSSMKERPRTEVKEWNTNLPRNAPMKMTESHRILRPMIEMGERGAGKHNS